MRPIVGIVRTLSGGSKRRALFTGVVGRGLRVNSSRGHLLLSGCLFLESGNFFRRVGRRSFVSKGVAPRVIRGRVTFVSGILFRMANGYGLQYRCYYCKSVCSSGIRGGGLDFRAIRAMLGCLVSL